MADAIDPRQLPATTQPYAAAPMAVQPPSQTDDLTAAMTRASGIGADVFQQEAQRRAQLAQQVAQLQQQRAGVGPLSYQPHMAPITGQGFGHDVGNLFGDIGKALLSFGANTVPGQAVQSGIYGKPRQEYGQLTQQIGEIQKQMGTTPEAMSAAGGMVSKPISAVGSVMRGQAAMSRADAEQYREKVLGEARIRIEQKANEIRQQLGQGKINAENARTQMMKVIADENNATKQNIANTITDTQLANEQTRAAEEQNKQETDHWLQYAIGMAPQKPVTPAGGTARKSQAQPQGGKNVAAGTIVYDLQGRAHRADGTAPLPQGWSLQKKTK